MAENDVQFEDGAQLQKGKGMLFAIVGAVVVLGGAGVYFATSGGGEAAEAKPAAKPGTVGEILPIPPFVVNLNETGNRYLKLSISIEMSGKDMGEEVTKRLPKIRDRVISYLVSLKVADVRGAETKDTIREVMLQKVNEAFGTEGVVKNVLFTEFVIQ